MIFWAGIVAAAGVTFAKGSPAQKSNSPVVAASGTGTLTGIVKDHHGVPVGGATVTVVNISTHQTRMGNTDGTGSFSFENLPEGEYEVTASARELLSKTDKTHVKERHVTTVRFKLKFNLRI